MNENILGTRIKEVRTKKGLTQKQLAEQIGISGASIISYEKGAKLPPLDTVIKIANTFEVSLDWLCGIETAGTKKELLTYADIVMDIISMADLLDMDVERNLDLDSYTDEMKFVLSEAPFPWLLDDWLKVRKLYHECVINKKIYDDWLGGAYLPMKRFTYDDDGREKFAASMGQFLEKTMGKEQFDRAVKELRNKQKSE